jgi:DNA primase
VGGRINEEDIAAVRDRARIEEVVGSYVTLRSAGGTMKGLCPFHDEKTPSFQVTPSRGYWYCFGACAEGGDVIDFMRKIDNLSFVEAVERLADRVGIQLRYTDETGPRLEPGARSRLAEALRLAADFVEHLSGPDAMAAGSSSMSAASSEAAERFDVGFCPAGHPCAAAAPRGPSIQRPGWFGRSRARVWLTSSRAARWLIRDSGRQVALWGAPALRR